MVQANMWKRTEWWKNCRTKCNDVTLTDHTFNIDDKYQSLPLWLSNGFRNTSCKPLHLISKLFCSVNTQSIRKKCNFRAHSPSVRVKRGRNWLGSRAIRFWQEWGDSSDQNYNNKFWLFLSLSTKILISKKLIIMKKDKQIKAYTKYLQLSKRKDSQQLPHPSLLSKEFRFSWKTKMAAALTRKSRLLAVNVSSLVTQCCCPSATLTFSRIQVRCKGHSQWQNRKFKKAHNDFARSKEFGKLSMEIITAVRGRAEFC